MTSRTVGAVVRRPNLPLTAKDEADLALMSTTPEYRQALSALAPDAPAPESSATEAALLHAIFTAGIVAIRSRAEEEGYRRLAQERAATVPERRREARTRKPRWAAEQ